MKKYLLSFVSLFLVTLFAAAQDEPAKLFADGKYYLQNVESGLYWGAGNDWGTRASLVKNPEYVTLIGNEDGTYKMETQVSNGGTAYYFDGDYMDNANAKSLTIAKVGDYYTISSDAGYYGYDAASTILGKGQASDANTALWNIISENEMLASLATATSAAPVDATFLLLDPNFGRNNRNESAWIVSEDCINKNLSGGNNINNCAESWHSVFTISQNITNAPAGVYRLTAQGFYRQDGSDEENLPVFYVSNGTEEATAVFPLRTGTENSMNDASASFSAGKYAADPIFFELAEGGTLTVGAKLAVNTNLWCIWDNFQLTYYGPDADIAALSFGDLVEQLSTLRQTAETLESNENILAATKQALQTALQGAAAVEQTEEAYNAAIAALDAAIKQANAEISAKTAINGMYAELDATNVYTAEAYETYKALADGYLAALEEGTLTETVVNPQALAGWHSANAIDDLLLSAWTIGGEQAKDYNKGLYINTWSVEGDNDGTNFRVPFFEYWTGDDQSLSQNTLTATVEGVEPGQYDVTAWVRVRAKNGYTAPAYGISLDVNGGEPVDVAAGEQVGTSQFYLAEYTAEGTVAEDGILKINFNIAADNNIHWLSFKNVMYAPTDNKYCLEFFADNKLVYRDYLNAGDTITVPDAPAKTGHTFVSWGEVPEIMPAQDVTYTAHYTPNVYRLRFYADGKLVSEDSLAYGTPITQPAPVEKEGYTFVSWGNVASAMPSQDLTYTARYIKNYYKVEFIAGGKVVSSDSLSYGDTITVPDAPEKTGHTFVSWGDVSETMPAHDVRYTAEYTPNVYRLRFFADGKLVSEDSLAYGTPITQPAPVEKEGYTFVSWGNVASAMPSQDLTYTARYIKNYYKVEFIAGGKVVSSDSLSYGDTITVPDAPEKTGHTFVSWGDVPEIMPAQNVTYTAEYTPNVYCLRFYADGKLVSEDSLAYGTPITQPAPVEKEGYTFVSWGNVASAMPSQDLTYTAHYIINQPLTVGSIQVNPGKTATVTAHITGATQFNAAGMYVEIPEGMTFVFDDEAEGYIVGGSVFAETHGVNERLQTSQVIKFAITSMNNAAFKDNEGTLFSFTISCSANVADGVYTGYLNTIEFSRSEAAGGGLHVMDNTPFNIIVGDGIPKYTATFIADGKVVSTQTRAEGDTLAIPDAPAKTGHTFVSWGNVSETMPAHDVQYTAEYTPNVYRLSFFADGKLVSEDSLAYGTPITQPAPVEKEGYTFVSWGNVASAMPSQDLTYTARYVINKYRLTFMLDNEVLSSGMVEYASVIDAPDVPEHEGYVFNGWTGLPMTMPATDLTIEGSYRSSAELTVSDPDGSLREFLMQSERIDEVKHFAVTGKMQADDYNALLLLENIEELTLPKADSRETSFSLGSLSKLLVVYTTSPETFMGDEVFEGCNPNLMVYAPEGASVGTQHCNVIIDGRAESIRLTDGRSVRIPTAFFAHQTEYRRSFSKPTVIGQSSGWETLVLPYYVREVETADGRKLSPFGTQSSDATRHFWLAQIGASGFELTTEMRANVPYIIAMPNNSTYTDEFNVTGEVIFRSKGDVLVHTTEAESQDGMYTFTPLYEPDGSTAVFTVNNDEVQGYAPGSVFIRGLRAARPFEAYITLPSGARQRDILPIQDMAGATGMNVVRGVGASSQGVYYTLSGRRVSHPSSPGIYIVRSGTAWRKVVIK